MRKSLVVACGEKGFRALLRLNTPRQLAFFPENFPRVTAEPFGLKSPLASHVAFVYQTETFKILSEKSFSDHDSGSFARPRKKR